MGQKRQQDIEGKTTRLDDLPQAPVTVGKKPKSPTKRVLEGEIVQSRKGIGGAPTTYTKETAMKICGLIAEGRSLRSIIREEEGMPAMSSVFLWLADHDEFSEQYTRAKEASADALADDIQDIAKQTLSGRYDPHASRVAIDAYKWTASKLKPKKYGDKLDIDSTSTVTHKLATLSDEDLDQQLKNAGMLPSGDIKG